MELKIENQARGVRIITGQAAKARRELLDQLIGLAESNGFEEIVLPSIEPSNIYVDKAGSEILSQMYVFPDRKARSLCLRPECTATVQLVADKHFKRRRKDLKFRFRRWERRSRWRAVALTGKASVSPSDSIG